MRHVNYRAHVKPPKGLDTILEFVIGEPNAGTDHNGYSTFPIQILGWDNEWGDPPAVLKEGSRMRDDKRIQSALKSMFIPTKVEVLALVSPGDVFPQEYVTQYSGAPLTERLWELMTGLFVQALYALGANTMGSETRKEMVETEKGLTVTVINEAMNLKVSRHCRDSDVGGRSSLPVRMAILCQSIEEDMKKTQTHLANVLRGEDVIDHE